LTPWAADINISEELKTKRKGTTMKTNIWTYEVYLNGTLVFSSNYEGIAFLKYQSTCLIGSGRFRRVYSGPDFDPVLHSPAFYDDSVGGWTDE
jgi:hypothetical protein